MSLNFISLDLSETYQQREGEERRSDSIAGGLVFAGTCCPSPATSTAFFPPFFISRCSRMAKHQSRTRMTADRDAEERKKTADTEVHTISVASRKHQAVQKGGRMGAGGGGHSSVARDQHQSPDSNVKLEWHQRKTETSWTERERRNFRGNLSQQSIVSKEAKKRAQR